MVNIQGLIRLYHDNKNVKLEGYFDHDLCHGGFTEYYRDGTVKVIATFNEGLIHGTLYKWYANGGVKLASQWYNGEPHGHLTSYYDTGNVMEEGLFWYGKICYFVQYDESGEIMERSEFLGIDPDDQYKYWYWVHGIVTIPVTATLKVQSSPDPGLQVQSSPDPGLQVQSSPDPGPGLFVHRPYAD